MIGAVCVKEIESADMLSREQSAKKINPGSALYIKLGRGGKYEQECIEVNHILWLGYREVPHQLCLGGEWEEAKFVL